MEISTLAKHTTIMWILFSVISWAYVNAQTHRSDEDSCTCDVINKTLKQFNNNLKSIEHAIKLLNDALTEREEEIYLLQTNILAINTTVNKHNNSTRALKEEISSILNLQKNFTEEFRSQLADLKHDLYEDRNTLEEKFVEPLEILNQTVQHLTHKAYKDLSQQVAELKAEQQQHVSLALDTSNNMEKALQEIAQMRENYILEITLLKAEQQRQASAALDTFEDIKKMKEALQEISQFKENYTSEITLLKAEQQRQASAALDTFEDIKKMKEALQEISQFKENYTSEADIRKKRAISNKCSLNVRHKPEGGRMDVLMVMDPPHIEPAACN